MRNDWDLAILDAKVPDELLDELCRNFGNAMWAHYMSGATIEALSACFKARCRNLSGQSPHQLVSIMSKLDYWFQELSQEEQAHFSAAFELLELVVCAGI